jgi:hypothetical protein
VLPSDHTRSALHLGSRYRTSSVATPRRLAGAAVLLMRDPLAVFRKGTTYGFPLSPLYATLGIPQVPYELNSDEPIAGTGRVGKSSHSFSRAPRERLREVTIHCCGLVYCVKSGS